MKPKNKKGAEFGFIISAIIVIVLLFGVSVFFTGAAWKGVKSFFGIEIEEDTTDFVYGKGCVDIASCSMDAFACAVNSMGRKEEIWKNKDDAKKYCSGYTHIYEAPSQPEVVGAAIAKLTGMATGSSVLAQLGTPNEDGIYTVSQGGASDIYFQYSNGDWFWSPDHDNWMKTDTTTVSAGSYKGQKPVQANIDLINKLNKEDPSPSEVADYYCKGIYFENICVECQGKDDSFNCQVKQFNLMQDLEKGNLDKAQLAVQGSGDPYYIAYYESFPEGEDKYWQADMFSWSVPIIVTAAVTNAVLGPGRGLGKSVSQHFNALNAQGIKKLSKEGTKATAKAFASQVVSQSLILKGIRKLLALAKGSTKSMLVKKKLILYAIQNMDDAFVKSLPDEGLDDLMREIGKKMARDGSIAKEAIEESFELVIRKYGDNAIDASASIARKIVSNLDYDGALKAVSTSTGAKAVLQKATKTYIREAIEESDEIAIELVRNADAEKLVMGLTGDTAHTLAEKIYISGPVPRGEITKFLTDNPGVARTIRDILSDTMNGNPLPANIQGVITPHNLISKAQTVAKRVADTNIDLITSNPKLALKSSAIQSSFRSLMSSESDDVIKAAAKAGKGNIMTTLSKELSQDMVGQLDDLAKLTGKITKSQLRLFSKIEKFESFMAQFYGGDAATARALAQQLDTKTLKTIEALADFSPTIQRNALSSSASMLSEVSPKSLNKMMKALDNVDAVILQNSYKKIEKWLPWIATGVYVTYEGITEDDFNLKEVGLEGGAVLVASTIASKVGVKTLKLGDFVRKNKLATLLVLGLTTNIIDQQLERNLPHGSNTLQLSTAIGPTKGELDSREFTSEVSPVYIELVKDRNQPPERFHLASPCKADLYLSRGKTICRMHKDISQYDFYNFGLGAIAVDSDTIVYGFSEDNTLITADHDPEINQRFENLKEFLKSKRTEIKDKNLEYGNEIYNEANWNWFNQDDNGERKNTASFTGWKYNLDWNQAHGEHKTALAVDKEGKLRVYEPFLNYWKTIRKVEQHTTDNLAYGAIVFHVSDGGEPLKTKSGWKYISINNVLFTRKDSTGEIQYYDKDNDKWEIFYLPIHNKEGNIIHFEPEDIKLNVDLTEDQKLWMFTERKHIKESNSDEEVKEYNEYVSDLVSSKFRHYETTRTINREEFFKKIEQADTYKSGCGISYAEEYHNYCCKYNYLEEGKDTEYELVSISSTCEDKTDGEGYFVTGGFGGGYVPPTIVAHASITNMANCGIKTQRDTTQYDNCAEAVQLYHEITYEDRDKYFYSELFDYDQEVHETIEQAEQSLLEIYKSALSTPELFKIIGKYSEYVAIVNDPKCKGSGKLWGCIIELLWDKNKGYFGTVNWATKGYMELESLKSVGDLLGSKNEFIDIRTKVDSAKNKGDHEYKWQGTDIALYMQYRFQDCLESANLISDIPVFYKLYDLDKYNSLAESDYISRCAQGINGIFPKFLMKKMIPHHLSYRRRIGTMADFDRYVIPEFRRIETDLNYDDDTFYDIMTKKRYYQSKADAIENARAASLLIKYFDKDYDRITSDDFIEFRKIMNTLQKNYPDKIDASKAKKLCKQPEMFEGSQFFENPHVNIAKSIQVTPNMHPYQENANYCYSNAYSSAQKWLYGGTILSSIFLDPILASAAEFFTGGCFGATVAAPGSMLCARGTLLAKGAIDATILRAIERTKTWPNHKLPNDPPESIPIDEFHSS